ncbi:hypothetical protein SISNIDRAFT_483497 [Sistotremastrum niveocremeum HHB9708]|uniref:Uncharacterized protein n=1 Tax=Sistotremastrum niveocremeum HHB9708 TaxID=1314777 RepID=A0A164XLM8_9AGAM|nr:hypothetical protein SISNIDRAFT_483497 [Sistotremastrum niveocremeum HHB9708]
MSDRAGFGSGGTSLILNATSPVQGSTNCSANPELPFTFEANSALTQDFIFSGYEGAALPLSFIGLIPGGETFRLETNKSGSYTWDVDVAAGTNVLFTAVDAHGNSGGSTDILRVVQSGDSSCMSSNSPSSTAGSSTPTSSPNPSDASSLSPASVAGVVIGVVLAILIISLASFCFIRRRKSSDPEKSAPYLTPQPFHRHDHHGSGTLRLIQPLSNQTPMITPTQLPLNGEADPTPFVLPEDVQSSRATDGLTHPHAAHFSNRRKSTLGSRESNPPTRFILHRDADEVSDHLSEEVVELPPLYRGQ